jgi:gamma-glutamyl-gamma-aminobutyrate hydrolase PuuD
MLSPMAAHSVAAAPLIVVTVADPAGSTDAALTLRKSQLYADAVRRHGGNPVLVSAAVPIAERDRLLAEMAGLLLTGGPDVDPALYGEEPAGAADLDPARDRLELAAWRAAQARSVPVLGICRGLQAINVFSGGKLLQDVPSHAGTPYGHGPAHIHYLEIEPRSKLGRAIASASPDGVAGGDPDDSMLELEVNTYHHQAVHHDALAAGLRAVAWSDSERGRLVEGLEGSDDRWLVAVQCHPERTESTPEEFAGLWADFVRAAVRFATTEASATPA